MKPIRKKHYYLTVNIATVLIILAAVLTDRYPALRWPLLAISASGALACFYVYLRHRFDVLAGRATDDALLVPASSKDRT